MMRYRPSGLQSACDTSSSILPVRLVLPFLLALATIGLWTGAQGQVQPKAQSPSASGRYHLAFAEANGVRIAVADVYLLPGPIDSTRAGPALVRELNGCYRIRELAPSYRGMLRLRPSGELPWHRGEGGAIRFTLNRTVDAGVAITLTHSGAKLSGYAVEHFSGGADTLGLHVERTRSLRGADCRRT